MLRRKRTRFRDDEAANKIYVHSCCVKISVSSYQQNFPFSVVDEKHRDVSLQAGARQIRPEF